jgi:hypothetical protein
VHDLVIHPRDDEIVIGTHGRGVFVLDARPIQQWAARGAAAGRASRRRRGAMAGFQSPDRRLLQVALALPDAGRGEDR